MSITLWSGPVQLYSSTGGAFADVDWLRSRDAMSGFPVFVDAETSATTYNAAGPNTYTVYLAAANWLGQTQAPVSFSGNFANISLPIGLVSATTFGTTNDISNDVLLTWQNSASVSGAYDLVLSPFTDSLGNIGTSTPAVQFSGSNTILASAVESPLQWTWASNSTYLAYVYATASGATTETINTVIYDSATGVATAPLAVETGVAAGGYYYDFYSSADSAFILAQVTTQNGAYGVDFSTISTTDGSLGAPVFQTFTPTPVWDPNNTGLSDYSVPQVKLNALTNGDYLEFVEWQGSASGMWNQYIETRLLSSNFTDITQTTTSFTKSEIFNNTSTDHWATTTLANGMTILVNDSGGLVFITQFDASGNQVGGQTVLPQPVSGQADDFDSLVAMGSRFEITYRTENATNTGNTVYSVIYDTATQGAAFTINDASDPSGQWVGTPFNDTVTYGAGVNAIAGGGGVDTFVAANFSPSQVSFTLDARRDVIVSDGLGDSDTLIGFSVVELSGATVNISGTTLTVSSAGSSAGVNISENGGALDVSGSSLLNLTGGGNSVSIVPGATVAILPNGGAWNTVTGTGGAVVLEGAAASIYGGGDTIWANTTSGNIASLYSTGGDWDSLIGSSDTLVLSNAQSSVTGGGDMIWANATTGNAVSLYATQGDWDSLIGSSDTLVLTDAQTSITGGGDTIWNNAAAGSAVSLYATNGDWDSIVGNGVTAILNSAQASVTGGNDVVWLNGSSTVTLYGAAGANDSVIGSGQTIIDAGAQTSVTGGGDTIWANTAGDSVSLYGTGGNWDTLIGGGDTVDFSSAQATIVGNSEVISLSGGNALTLYGNSEQLVTGAALGQDLITNFNSSDSLQFGKLDFASFSVLQSHMAQVGANTVITENGSNALTLLGFAASSLTSAQCHFV